MTLPVLSTCAARQGDTAAPAVALPRVAVVALPRKTFFTPYRDAQPCRMIEGFPRSGTSFAVQAMQSANPDLAGRIATHVHASAHLIRAAQLACGAWC